MAKFKTALEARAYLEKVYFHIKGLPYNSDIRKLLLNCSRQVDILSSLEVTARRSGNDRKVREYLVDMHRNIENVEKWVIMLKLMA
jgi:hypothetical protein